MLNAAQKKAQDWVFVVDDDGAARDSIAALALSRGLGAEKFSSAEEFLTAYDESRPGCVVAELGREEMSGLDLLDAVSRVPGRPPVVMMTALSDVALAVRAMAMGALTVLPKPCSESELWDAICRAVALDASRRQDEAYERALRARMESLTADEKSVLDGVLAGKTNKGIARELRLGLRTIEARRHSIMAKIGARSLAELVCIAWEARVRSCRSRTRFGEPASAGEKPHDRLVACRTSETAAAQRPGD